MGDHISRVRMVRENSDWDLSPNDRVALQHILDIIDGKLMDGLVRAALLENNRAVKQAMLGKVDPHTGQLWETCFRRVFEGVLGL